MLLLGASLLRTQQRTFYYAFLSKLHYVLAIINKLEKKTSHHNNDDSYLMDEKENKNSTKENSMSNKLTACGRLS